MVQKIGKRGDVIASWRKIPRAAPVPLTLFFIQEFDFGQYH